MSEESSYGDLNIAASAVKWEQLKMAGLADEYSMGSKDVQQRCGSRVKCSSRVDSGVLSKIPTAKLCQKAGMDPPVTSSLLHRDLSSLKAFMKGQIVTDSVLPAYSILSEARIVVLDEIIYLSQSEPFLR